MSALADKIRAARKIEITVGKAKFFATRATLEQAMMYNNRMGEISDADICRKHVTGWDNVTEADVIPGGSDKKIDFDFDTFSEVIGEMPEWWGPISREIVADAIDKLSAKASNKKK